MIVVANKAEGRAGESGRFEAYRLGLGEPIALSAEHGEGVADLFEALRPHVEHEHFEAEEEEREEGAPLSLAIVGRPNAGKSTLVNRMLGEERMITGPEAGITRDSISIEWEWNGRPCGWSTPRASGNAPRSRTSSSACPRPTPSARSTMPRSSSCCWTQRGASKRRTCASPPR